ILQIEFHGTPRRLRFHLEFPGFIPAGLCRFDRESGRYDGVWTATFLRQSDAVVNHREKTSCDEMVTLALVFCRIRSAGRSDATGKLFGSQPLLNRIAFVHPISGE